MILKLRSKNSNVFSTVSWLHKIVNNSILDSVYYVKILQVFVSQTIYHLIFIQKELTSHHLQEKNLCYKWFLQYNLPIFTVPKFFGTRKLNYVEYLVWAPCRLSYHNWPHTPMLVLLSWDKQLPHRIAIFRCICSPIYW